MKLKTREFLENSLNLIPLSTLFLTWLSQMSREGEGGWSKYRLNTIVLQQAIWRACHQLYHAQRCNDQIVRHLLHIHSLPTLSNTPIIEGTHYIFRSHNQEGLYQGCANDKRHCFAIPGVPLIRVFKASAICSFFQVFAVFSHKLGTWPE